jgi:hypothetical protein
MNQKIFYIIITYPLILKLISQQKRFLTSFSLINKMLINMSNIMIESRFYFYKLR